MPRALLAFLVTTALVTTALVTTALALAGCGGEATEEGAEEATNVEITAAERSPAIQGASAQFTQPTDGEVVQDTSYDVVVAVGSFEAGVQTETPRAQEIANSADGQHVHIILDNEPYMANYNPGGEPFDIGTLSPGAHTLVVFPSRSYHESVKNEGAHDVVNFYVGEETGEPMIQPDQPTIIYSRPKGSYSGADAEQILLDFYLHNVELSPDGYKARYTIRRQGQQEEFASMLDEWTPAFVTGLTSGTYVVRLQLLDAEGNVVPGPFNDTEREIEVQADNASM